MEAEKRPTKLLNIKTVATAIMLSILLMQLIGCASTPANPGAESSSLSPTETETEAKATAINAWIALFDAHQGSSDRYVNITFNGISHSVIEQELEKGNTVSFTWQARNFWWGDGGTNGQVQIKNFKSQITSLSLSPADQANGITWQGNMNFALLMRYRIVGWEDNYSINSPDSLTPPDSEPFSPWQDVGAEMNSYASKIIYGNPVSISIVKQNGAWSANVNALLPSDPGIILPLPLPFEGYYESETTPYKIAPTQINQSSGIPTSNDSSDVQLIAQAQLATQGKSQPGNYNSCLVYAQARGLGVTAKGNTGAFNVLYQGNDAKLVNNSPAAQLKTGILPLNNGVDLTTVLHPGDFMVWQRGIAGADPIYGHIAVVELVVADRVVISQADWAPAWKVLHTSDFVIGMYDYPIGLP